MNESKEDLVAQIVLDLSGAVDVRIDEWPLPAAKLEEHVGWVRLLQVDTDPPMIITAGAGLWHGPEYAVPYRSPARVEDAVNLAAMVAYYNLTKAHLAIGEFVEHDREGRWLIHFSTVSPAEGLERVRKLLALNYVYRVRLEEARFIRAHGWASFAQRAADEGVDLCDWTRREVVAPAL